MDVHRFSSLLEGPVKYSLYEFDMNLIFAVEYLQWRSDKKFTVLWE